MKIKNLEDFVNLIELYKNKQLPNQEITLDGIAKFRKHFFQARQALTNPQEVDTLSPQSKRLYSTLSALEPTEVESLAFATNTSYFTPEAYCQSLATWSLNYFKNTDNQKVSILEPSAGSGAFIKALIEQNASSDKPLQLQIDALEKDIFTANILEHNFKQNPEVTVHQSAFEQAKLHQSYQLIIGNIPFGNFTVFDKHLSQEQRDLVGGKIHNYFFLKSIDYLEPAGLLLYITSREIADSLQEKALREHLVQHLNLTGAIRLDEAVFKDADTKVITDVLIFQKPLLPKQTLSKEEQTFIESSKLPLALEHDINYNVNHYFQNNPERILGKYYPTTGIAGKPTLSIKTEQSKQQEFTKLLQEFIQEKTFTHVFQEKDQEKVKSELTIAQENHNRITEQYPLLSVGNVVCENNQFFKIQKHDDFPEFTLLKPISVYTQDKERFASLLEMRNTYLSMRHSIRLEDFDKAKQEQDKLNGLYDNFVFFYNFINSHENRNVLVLDFESEILKALEVQAGKEYLKSDIFSKNFTQELALEKVDTIEQAIYHTMNDKGFVDVQYMGALLQRQPEDFLQEAINEQKLFINPIFEYNDPTIKGFSIDTIESFLSGYVEYKADLYKRILDIDHVELNPYKGYLNRTNITKNTNLLVENFPVKLSIEEIDPSLGEPWIPLKVYQKFLQEHLEDAFLTLEYQALNDRYKINSKGSKVGMINYSIRNASDRLITYNSIIGFAFMQNQPDFKKKVFQGGKEITVSDKNTNTAVSIIIEQLHKEFSKWLMKNNVLAEQLENGYHFLNNGFVKEKVNPNYLDFSNIKHFTPYDHQKNVCIQLSKNNGGIIDHEVGFGKTLTMAMLCMTKKKFKVNKKELIVGFNANYKDIYTVFKQAFPEAKVWLLEENDLKKENIKQTLFQIANNNYDAIITSHSSLMKFPISPKSEKQIVQDIIAECHAVLSDTDKKLTPAQERKLLQRVNDAEARQLYLQEALQSKKVNGTLFFDDLGFDGIIIDESHYFKNLEFKTKHANVSGIGNQDSVAKTANLLSYIRYIQSVNQDKGKCKGVTFASGTIISNSISELFSLFKYIIPDDLKAKGIDTFDKWARVFARKTQEYEEGVTGNIKLKERFRYFVKVPELAKMYNDITHYADFRTFPIERPTLQNQLINVEPHTELKDYLDSIRAFGSSKRIEDLPYYRGSSSDIKSTVGLICTSQGKKAALTLKLIHPDLPDSPNDKINTAVSTIVEQYHNYQNIKGTQLVFCDLGVPNSNEVSFNVYRYMKELLVQKGIPSGEIAFIHDYDKKKETLFNAVNQGAIRILIGSTTKMGVGVNVQQRIVAMHHLDLPWRPADISQRNGRGERPGNKITQHIDNTIKNYIYATKGTLDAYIFNLLQIKQNFIYQIKNASLHTRKIDEGVISSDGSLNYEEYMAACSQNQYLTEKLKAEKELQKLIDVRNSFIFREKNNKIHINYYTREIGKIESSIELLHLDKKLLKDFNPHLVQGKIYTSDKELSQFFQGQLQPKLKEQTHGTFTLALLDKQCELQAKIYEKEGQTAYLLMLKTPNNIYTYGSKNFVKNDKDNALYALHCLERIDSIIKEQQSICDTMTQSKNNYEQLGSVKFDKHQQIVDLELKIKDLNQKIEDENKSLSQSSTLKR